MEIFVLLEAFFCLGREMGSCGFAISTCTTTTLNVKQFGNEMKGV